MKEIGIKRAAAYNLVAKFSTMFIQLILNMILARLIAPEAFGVVSITTVLINFFNMFADMGVGVSVIQNKNLDKKALDRLFTLSLYIGLVLSAIMILISFPVSAIYQNSIYKILCPCISVIALINSLNTVPNAILSRDKRFDLIALRSFLSNLVSGIITAVLAFLGFGIYALILHSILTILFVFVWNYVQNPLRLVKHIDLKNLMGVLGSYSLFQLLFNLMNYLTRNLDSLFIGGFFGEKQLGYYNKAYTLNLYPNTLFTNVLSGVLHPYMRDFSSDREALYKKLMQIVKFLSLIGIFIQMVFFWCSDEIIEIMFGPNWGQAAVCFHWLSLCVWAQMLSSVCGSVFLGLKRTDQTFRCGVVNLVLIVAAIVVGIYSKSLAVLSLSVAIIYNIIFFITYVRLIVFTMKSSLKLFIKTVGCDFIGLAIFTAAVFIAPEMSENIWLSLLIKVGLTAIYYLLYLIVTRQFSQLFGVLLKKLLKKAK